MKAIQIEHFGPAADVVAVVDLPDAPEPTEGEVKVSLRYWPINPADLLQLEGQYGTANAPLPLIPGGEGMGTVSSVGPGVTSLQLGDRVLVLRADVGGTWREQVTVKAEALAKLPHASDERQFAMLGINAPSAWLLLNDFVQLTHGDWIIQNAANSAVSRMVSAMAVVAGVHTINVVRRASAEPQLRNAGIAHVVYDGEDLAERVRAIVGEGRIHLAIDAVGGKATARLAKCLGEGGTLVNYGVLEGRPCEIDGNDLIFRNITLRGFWLRNWFIRVPIHERRALYERLAALMAEGVLETPIEQLYPMSQIAAAVAHAGRTRRSGKILLTTG
jgi:mitochondrial enoyl-[acyl-carrier protein] reductase / trans-2-enoyl-CoA reductase